MQTIEESFDRGCRGKLRHPTEEAACMALESLKNKKNCRRKVKLTVYRCKFGNHWHLGRQRKNRRDCDYTKRIA